jgi:Flp pilus assembly pilin Flp
MKMRFLKNEKGIALVMVLILSVIALAIVSTLLYLVMQGTKTSSSYKRYETALDAGHGGSEIASALISNRGNLVISGLSGINFPNQCVCGFDSNPYDEVYPLPSPDTCLCRKLCMPAYESGGTYIWGASGSGACNTAGASMDPTTDYDVQFDLPGSGSITYQVSGKIVDTTVGVTDLSGEQLSCGTGAAYQCGTFSGPPTPYLYRVELNSQDSSHPTERARLSILYAY